MPHAHHASRDREQPEIRMSAAAFRHILCEIASRPPESGGLLLGPVASTEITEFYFDATAECRGDTYSPDHVTLTRLMRERWLPSGIDMKGFVHSHPQSVDALSPADLRYIRRLLRANDDMSVFAAPLVIPAQYRFCPFVVLRTDPDRARRALLVLF